MDSITSALLNLGVGGIMAAAVVFMVWHNTTKTIPDLMKDVSEGREKFLTSLRELEGHCHEEINRTNEIWATKFDKLTERLTDKLSDKLVEDVRSMKVRRSEG